jgi:HlyD family secretion protein
MTSRTRWILAILSALIAAAALYFRADADAAAPKVVTAKVTRGPVVATVEATGTLQPVDTVEVGTQVTGTIRTLGADFNARVAKGQIIATLDPALFQSQVSQAQATVGRLRAELERSRVQARDAEQKLSRARSLSDAQLLPASDLETAATTADAAQAVVKSAQAQLAEAEGALQQSQVNLSHTIIRTPVDGIVLSRNVEVGQTVAAGLQAPTLFVIARDLETMQLDASVNEADIGRVATGQPVRFRVDAYGQEQFSGTVQQVRLQPTVTQNVVTYTTVIGVPNDSAKLKPGMTATVSIEVGRVEDALRVPAAALNFRPSRELLDAVNGQTRGRVDPPATGSDGHTDAFKQAPGPGHTPPREQQAVVWQLADGRLQAIRVQPGLADDMVVALLRSPLEPGNDVVTGVAPTASVQGANSQSSGASPLLPNLPRRGGAGARPGRS